MKKFEEELDGPLFPWPICPECHKHMDAPIDIEWEDMIPSDFFCITRGCPLQPKILQDICVEEEEEA